MFRLSISCLLLQLFAPLVAFGFEQQIICRFCDHQHRHFAPRVTAKEANGFNYAPDRQVDVLHIKIDVTPDFKQHTVSGTTSITFAPISKPLKQLKLDAYHLSIAKVDCSEVPVADFSSTRNDLTVLFENEVSVGKEVTLHIQYSAEPVAGLYFRTPEMGYPASDTHIWTQGEAHEARHWFPCFDYPNERSSTEVICHVPAEMTVLSNGKKMSEEINTQTGLKRVRWLQEKPHVNYLICLVAGHLKQLEKQHRDIPLRFYVQPSLFDNAANSFRDTDQIMAFFEEEIGINYPWNKYDQVTILDFTAGGMENTTLTTLTHRTIFSEATENIRTTRGLDAHEMAHQWFGDYVTCKDWSHLWLNEGFATYYTHLYEGHKFGRDAMLYGLYRDATRSVLTKGSDKKPIVYKAYNNAMDQFDYRAYPKGSWVLHMLRSQLGKDLYRQAIKTYLEKHALTSVVTDDLRQVIEEVSGQPFDRFFDQWVYHARHPDLKISYKWLPGVKLAKVTIEQTHETNGDVLLFQFPTVLRFIGDTTVDHAVDVREKKHEVFVPLASKPKIVRFDPEFTLLATVKFDKPDEMLLAQLTNKEDMIGRVLAAKALGKRKTKKAIEALKDRLSNDEFFGVRITASEALAGIKSDESFEALVASRDQPDARVRRQVVQDIGKWFRPESFELALQILDSEKNPAIAAEAVTALGRFSGKQAREGILGALRSDTFRNELANAAIRTIQSQNDPSYRKPLMKVLKQKESSFSDRGFSMGLGALAQISRELEVKEAVRDFLTGYVNHPKLGVQLAAIRALGSLRDVRATPVLESFASSEKNSEVGKVAKASLEQLRKVDNIVPKEVVELRQSVADLKADNKKLEESLAEIKEQLKALHPEANDKDDETTSDDSSTDESNTDKPSPDESNTDKPSPAAEKEGDSSTG